MTERIVQKLRDSAAARWGVLLLVSTAMMSGYIISDVVAPLKTMLEQAPTLWDSTDYGLFTSGYGWLNIFLLMLIFGGMILDRLGVRFTGVLSIAIMIAGTAIKYWAITTPFADPVIHLPFGLEFKRQVLYAALGFAVFGTGVEMIGITANKAVVKWFRGREMALAIGMNTAFGRVGTLIALNLSPKIAVHFGSIGAPIAMGLGLLCLGLCSFLVFCVLDRRLDRQDSHAGLAPQEPFRFRDIGRIASDSGFWLITVLCVLFYSAVFPYLKFAPDFMFQKFGIPLEKAGEIPSLLPLGTLLLTPLFGYLYDRRGRGASIMIVGAVLLVVVHALFSVPALDATWVAVALTVLLGIAFSLVPSAMWPSVAKIMPENKLGTAYSMIFWVQNIGLSFVPMGIGWVLSRYCQTGETVVDGVLTPTYDYTIPMLVFAGFGVLSILTALWLRRDDARKGYGLELPNIKK